MVGGIGAVLHIAYAALADPFTIPWAVLPLFLTGVGVSLVFPILTLAILDMYPRQRGASSSLQAFTSLVVAALVSGALSPWLSHDTLHLALGSATLTLLGWVFWRWERSVCRQPPADFTRNGRRNARRRSRPTRFEAILHLFSNDGDQAHVHQLQDQARSRQAGRGQGRRRKRGAAPIEPHAQLRDQQGQLLAGIVRQEGEWVLGMGGQIAAARPARPHVSAMIRRAALLHEAQGTPCG